MNTDEYMDKMLNQMVIIGYCISGAKGGRLFLPSGLFSLQFGVFGLGVKRGQANKDRACFGMTK